VKYILPICLFILSWSVINAQDTIVQISGNRITAKALQIDKSDVTYKKFENLEGPSYVIPKSDISIIRYQNGSVDTFNIIISNPKERPKYVNVPKSEMYIKGEEDADMHYTKFKSAGHWTLGLTLPLNALGIIPAVAISATEPKRENLDYPDLNLLNNSDYIKGYVAKAKNKKGKYVMKNFLFGCLGSFAMYGSILLLSK
jgi:hypothetical protein